MSRNQIFAICACAALCVGIYLFASTKKPKTENAVAEMADGHQQPQADTLDIEGYISQITAQLPDSLKNNVQRLVRQNDYLGLAQTWQKRDKPLAVAYYSVKLAELENKPELYAKAGEYNSMLLQSAPDEKSRNFLSSNILECYKAAADLDSTNTSYKINLASAYIEGGGAPMQGVGILLEIVHKDSNNIEAQMMLGRFGIMSGQFDKAIARLQKILYLQPQNSEALLLMAQAYESEGNKDQAIEALQRCKKTLTDPEARKQVEDYIEKLKKPNS